MQIPRAGGPHLHAQAELRQFFFKTPRGRTGGVFVIVDDEIRIRRVRRGQRQLDELSDMKIRQREGTARN